MQHVGITVFGNKIVSNELPKKIFNSNIELMTVDMISQGNRFKVEAARHEDSSNLLVGVGLNRSHTVIGRYKQRKEKTKRVAMLEDAELLLLLRPRTLSDSFFGTNQKMSVLDV